MAGVLADGVEITLDHIDQRRLDRDPAVRCRVAIVASWYAGVVGCSRRLVAVDDLLHPGGEGLLRRRLGREGRRRLAHVLARTRLASPLGRPRAYSRASQPPQG